MSGLFPFISVNAEEDIVKKELPPLREIAIDFKTGAPIVENKMFKTVEGVEALKVWIYRALKVERFVYDIYSWDFGSEMYSLFGKGYSNALTKEEVKRLAKEAVLINPYILDVEIKDISFIDADLTINMKIESVFGDEEFKL